MANKKTAAKKVAKKAVKAVVKRKCSLCGKKGHNLRTCGRT